MLVIYEKSILDNLINLGGSLLIRLIVYYFWCRKSKESFYYKEKLENQTNWNNDILNHWNSGVLIYNQRKQKVKIINNYLKKFDEFQWKNTINEENDNLNNNNILVRTEEDHEHNNMLIVNNKNIKNENKEYNSKILQKFNIFKNIIDVNIDLPEEIINSFTQSNNFTDIISVINNYYNCESDNNFRKEFVFLGHIYLTSENKKGLFEISLHIFHNHHGYYYELMINDVTKTKKLEEERIKDKTLILGKISHEFKNPLVVIDEVVEQLIEHEEDIGLQNLNKKELINKMFFIKNLTNYMLILVKDFEVVASLENFLEIIPVNETLEIKPFLKEIGQIVETLIVKKSAKNLFFKLSIDESLDKIYIDSLRLKQILINLLSNSVKFTGIGFIELKVEVLNRSNAPLLSLAKDTKENYVSVTDINLQIINNVDPIHNQKVLNKSEEIEEKIWIRFSVIDSGKGISDTLMNQINSEISVKVFQKDNSYSNKSGTGYGLNIVQKLCKVLNSKLLALRRDNSSPGSIFYFEIPISRNKVIFINNKYNEEIKDKKPITQLPELIPVIPNSDININKNNNIHINEGLTNKFNTTKSKVNYDKLVFDHYPNIVNETKNLFKSDKNINNALMENNDSIKEIETPIIKSSKDLQFHKEYIEIQNDLLSLNDSSFETMKRLYEIKLPKNFFIQDSDKEESNNNSINEIKEDNHINLNKIECISQTNGNNLKINNEIIVSDIILKNKGW